jgi:hypothetical protein
MVCASQRQTAAALWPHSGSVWNDCGQRIKRTSMGDSFGNVPECPFRADNKEILKIRVYMSLWTEGNG